MASLKERLQKGWEDVKGIGEVALKTSVTPLKRAIGDDSPVKLSPNAQRVLDVSKEKEKKNGAASK